MHLGFRWRELREGDNLKDPGVDERILKWILKTWDGAWTGSISTVSGLL